MGDANGFTIVPVPAAPGITSGDDHVFRPTKADGVLDALGAADVRYWHDPDGRAFATVQDGKQMLQLDIQSRAFSLRVREIVGQAYPVKGALEVRPSTISRSVIKDALLALECIAQRGP